MNHLVNYFNTISNITTNSAALWTTIENIRLQNIQNNSTELIMNIEKKVIQKLKRDMSHVYIVIACMGMVIVILTAITGILLCVVAKYRLHI